MRTTRAIRIALPGLGCGEARVIERRLATARGVWRAHVNPIAEAAYVDYDPSETAPEALRAAIEQAGYRALLPAD